jgi:hypothetical protein
LAAGRLNRATADQAGERQLAVIHPRGVAVQISLLTADAFPGHSGGCGNAPNTENVVVSWKAMLVVAVWRDGHPDDHSRLGAEVRTTDRDGELQARFTIHK